jgi:hypothetical protein
MVVAQLSRHIKALQDRLSAAMRQSPTDGEINVRLTTTYACGHSHIVEFCPKNVDLEDRFFHRELRLPPNEDCRGCRHWIDRVERRRRRDMEERIRVLEQELEAAHAADDVVGQRLLEIEDVVARLEVSFDDFQREMRISTFSSRRLRLQETSLIESGRSRGTQPIRCFWTWMSACMICLPSCKS